jgi:hypothetical protein
MRQTVRSGRALASALFAFVLLASIAGTAAARPVTRSAELERLSDELRAKLDARRGTAYHELLQSEEPAQVRLNEDSDIALIYVDERGRPIFYGTENLTAAQSISTDEVWPGGSLGLGLTGGTTARGELCIWDGGAVLASHQEFGGRVIQEDNPGGTHFHATHVAGTMIGGGVHPTARGMSYEAGLSAYDWSYDDSEMASAGASGAQVSNHSYGFITGWYYNQEWYWYGDTDVSEVEEYGFGYYSDGARSWDQIAANAPYYTIVKSAGNDRSDAGPSPGGGHYVWNGSWVWSTAVRERDGGADGYDSVSWAATAKNIITVGAVQDIPGGCELPSDISMTSFSCWGPTDDGRIKPDLVANGSGLYSCVDASPTSYASYSGTSMASPNLSGSLNLLIQHYEASHGGERPLSATTKAVLIATADEAGASPGPDYACGWGLANTLRAADLIEKDASDPGHIVEAELENGAAHEYWFASDGVTPLRLAIAWTDPAGVVSPPSLDSPALKLVNDLDVRIERAEGGTVFEPYVLDPANPALQAVTGDNFRDNVERVDIAVPAEGQYLVSVTHKGALSASQTYAIASTHPLVEATTGVDDGGLGGSAFVLQRNFPNPFTPSTTIRYELPAAADVTLRVHDASGRIVRVLAGGGRETAGAHQVEWNGKDAAGRDVASGVYFYRIDVGSESETRRMVLLK